VGTGAVGMAQPNDRRGPRPRPDAVAVAAGAIGTAASAAFRGSETTVIPSETKETVTVPSRSVR
jgi:hypothetical protein